MYLIVIRSISSNSTNVDTNSPGVNCQNMGVNDVCRCVSHVSTLSRQAKKQTGKQMHPCMQVCGCNTTATSPRLLPTTLPYLASSMASISFTGLTTQYYTHTHIISLPNLIYLRLPDPADLCPPLILFILAPSPIFLYLHGGAPGTHTFKVAACMH